jgi:streptogramin lyase
VWSRSLPGVPDQLAWLDGTLYALLSAPDRILSIDPATSFTHTTFTLPGVDAIDLTAANGLLWTTVRGPDWIMRLDPRTGRRGVAYVGRSPAGVSVHGNDVWVSLWAASRVVLVDAHSLRRRAGIDVALNPFTLRSDRAGAWVVCVGEGLLLRLKKL